MYIQTTETRERVARPTTYGMHPAVAERLRALGVDPEAHAREIALARGTPRGAPVAPAVRLARAAQTLGVGLAPRVGAGGAIELSLDPNDVWVTPLLNQGALMYEGEQDYVADIVAPVQLVGEKSAKYKIWDRGPFRSLLDARIGPTGSAKEVSPTLSEDNYSVVRRALKGFAEDDTELAAPALNVRLATVEQVTELHKIGREYDVATMFHTTGNYPAGNVKTLTTGTGGTNWLRGSAADPIADVLSMMEAIPGPVTHFVVSDIVWHGAQRNAALKTILASQYDNKGLLRPMDFALYFGIPNMIITSADYRDDTGARKRLWSETGAWMGSVQAGRDRRTFCRTFRLKQGAGGWITKRWRDEDRGSNGGEWNRVAYEEDRKIVSSDYGVVFVNVIG